MHRAHAILTTKSIQDADSHWHIEGVATTPTVDRMGDIVVSTGAKFKTPLPLLWQHDPHKPVGLMHLASPTKAGISYRAQIPKVSEPGVLKDRVDEAIHSIKYGLVRGVSIGFRAINGAVDHLDNGGLRFNEWEWLELSLVTIPANAEATIANVKRFDEAARAAAPYRIRFIHRSPVARRRA